MSVRDEAQDPRHAALRVDDRVVIPRSELQLSFARSGGPGGQNVNKVETKVLLRFSIERSQALDEGQRQRLRSALANRLTAAGEVLVHADRHRDRASNIQDARERLATLLARALRVPKKRRPTRPSRGAVEKRLASKRKRSERKQMRGGAQE